MKFVKILPLLCVVMASTAQADNLVDRLNQVDQGLQSAVNSTQNSIRDGQNRIDNTQRSINEIKDGTYVENRVNNKVRNTKRRAVDNMIQRSNNAIRKATNTY
ncbi:hypothetical protein DA099_13570 [Photobacterium damselae]|uniref:Uncharacterized protein n=1 Tax=Photobacterium damselae TaxID=38293 RepID=A0ACD3SXP3_PHODM|nr:hypothetical protein [Photobacterium damselae]RDL33360.1 hypothetical protein BC461_06330 [Photobacterium damselae]TMX47606.1 hypothetical protein DA099_13570 [Photobacterium damselae]TMX64001.1 hypothetical protein DA090_15650 [Photobacterium damselae]TMX70841.1 hypothetical protein DA092_19620 [Photobacterium damselae]